jgi:hypothetical protein
VSAWIAAGGDEYRAAMSDRLRVNTARGAFASLVLHAIKPNELLAIFDEGMLLPRDSLERLQVFSIA